MLSQIRSVWDGLDAPWLAKLGGLGTILWLVPILFGTLRALSAFDALTIAVLAVGLVGFAVQALRHHRGHRGRPGQDDDLFALLEAWAKPAFNAAVALVDKARTELFVHTDDPTRNDLAVLYQKALDEGKRAYSLASNAIVNRRSDSDPEEALGQFYSAYQGLSTYVERGFAHGVLEADELWYQEWRKADPRFLDELKRVIGDRRRETLRRQVYAVGWGEGVRAKLPQRPQP